MEDSVMQTRQAVVLLETIKCPRTQRWSNELRRSCMHLRQGTGMHWLITLHRADQAEIVGLFCDLWKYIEIHNPLLLVGEIATVTSKDTILTAFAVLANCGL